VILSKAVTKLLATLQISLQPKRSLSLSRQCVGQYSFLISATPSIEAFSGFDTLHRVYFVCSSHIYTGTQQPSGVAYVDSARQTGLKNSTIRKGKFCSVFKIRPRKLPFTPFPIHYPLIIVSLDTMYS